MRGEAAPAVKAEVKAAGATTNVDRGRPQYPERTDPVLFASGSLTIEALGPGSLMLALNTATALLHHDVMSGHQLDVSPSAAYSLSFGDSTRVKAGFGLKLFPYADQLDAAHELIAAVEQDAAGFTFALRSWVEIVNELGAYVAASVARPVSFGALTLTPSLSTGVDAQGDRLPIQRRHRLVRRAVRCG